MSEQQEVQAPEAPVSDIADVVEVEQQAVEAPEPEEAPEEAEEEAPKEEEKAPEPKEAPAPKEAPKQQPAYTPEQIEKARAQAIEQIEKRFQFTDEEREALHTEPDKVLPRLAARLQVETYEMVLAALQAALPALIGQAVQGYQVAQTAQSKFYERWPELNKPEYSETIRQVSAQYRRAFPDASPEEAIEDIGRMVMRKLGIKPKTPELKARPTSPPPRTYVPAGAGAASARTARQKPEPNPWAELVED